MGKSLTTGIILGGVFLLGGCYQDVNVSLHDPGVYKGQHDALLAKLKTPDWQNKLSERFKMGQSDR